jgi:hypothetical protein
MKSNYKEHFILPLGLVCVFASITQAADPVEELKACARTTDRDARLACYDELGERAPKEEVSDVKSPSEVSSLPDDIGGAVFEERANSEKKQDMGLVTSCKKGSNKRWYFTFENGQVWKEVHQRKYRFRECNFVATISKDGFGYVLRIEGDDRKIRVSRVK